MQKEGVEYAQRVSMGDDEDMLAFIRKNAFIEVLQPIPDITPGLRIGEQSVVHGFFLTLLVFPQPSYGFPHSSAQIPFPRNLRKDRFDPKMLSDDLCGLLSAEGQKNRG